MAFRVHVDSSADIPAELAQRKGIHVTPLPVTMEGRSYLEGVNLTAAEFYRLLAEIKDLPKTSQPTLGDLIEVYNGLLASGDEVISILISSGFSSTINVGRQAREQCDAPERLHVIDSLGACLGFGLIGLKAAELGRTGSSWSDLEQEILTYRDHMRYLFLPDTLEYMVKGGRVSKAIAAIGGVLDIKQILRVTPQGTIEAYIKVRSRRAGIRKLAEVTAEEAADPANNLLGIAHSNCPEEAAELAAEISSRVTFQEVIISEIGSVVGTHTGPGTLASFFLRK
ncbi:MAG: DegV family protein [Peptococcaceae bacterium]|jgi:DegV family protein with EDD domain|nr:DegV family protein [Peptococcaceae bacterium]